MEIHIDQSIKIEQTNRDTAIGLSNDVQFSVIISGKIKRRLQEDFRRQGKRRLFMYRTFMAGVVLLLQRASIAHLPSIVIDIEYPGHEIILRSMFLEMWTRFAEEVPVVRFERVGKSSESHRISHETATGKRKPDYVLSYQELRQLVLAK